MQCLKLLERKREQIRKHYTTGQMFGIINAVYSSGCLHLQKGILKLEKTQRWSCNMIKVMWATSI